MDSNQGKRTTFYHQGVAPDGAPQKVAEARIPPFTSPNGFGDFWGWPATGPGTMGI